MSSTNFVRNGPCKEVAHPPAGAIRPYRVGRHHHHHYTYGCIIIAKLFTDVDRVPALDCLVVTPSTSTCASSSGNQHELLASTKTAASVERSNMIRERKILYFGHFAKTIIQCVVVCLQNQPEVIGFLVSLGKVKVRQLYPVESG